MAKKGGTHHSSRLAVPSVMPITGRKERKWTIKPRPGAHKGAECISLGIVLRDLLKVAANSHEARGLANTGQVLVNGKKAKDIRCPVGIMDIISIPKTGKSYTVTVKSKRFGLLEAAGKDVASKLCKVVGKRTIRGNKVALTMHDGRNLIADNSYKVGDSVVFDLAAKKPSGVLKFGPGAKCLVTSGMHKGAVAKLVGVVERKGSMDAEAKLEGKDGEFVTLAKYLFVVGEQYTEQAS